MNDSLIVPQSPDSFILHRFIHEDCQRFCSPHGVRQGSIFQRPSRKSSDKMVVTSG